MKDNITIKLIFIGLVALVCLVASGLVLGLVSEREGRYREVEREVGEAWGAPQSLLGPVLTFKENETAPDGSVVARTRYVLPQTLIVESVIEPEVRSRGIFDTVVYTEHLRVQGTFLSNDVDMRVEDREPSLVVVLPDTRSIETQVALTWNDATLEFEPGTNERFFGESGIHVRVPFSRNANEYAFQFDLVLRGSNDVTFMPVGKATHVAVSSSWSSPEFTGAFLPSERTLNEDGFRAAWSISSFGRDFPQSWVSSNPVSLDTILDSGFSVRLYKGVDLYTQVERATKYAVLFIVVVFTVFFLLEVLTRLHIHPVQYTLIGAALALFYLLLLSLTEHLGFLWAYVIATVMTTALITGYSMSVLKQKGRAVLVSVVLIVLYGYLYFVLKLEDYALLFGSLLVFVLLGSVMYLTRDIDWFHIKAREKGSDET